MSQTHNTLLLPPLPDGSEDANSTPNNSVLTTSPDFNGNGSASAAAPGNMPDGMSDGAPAASDAEVQDEILIGRIGSPPRLESTSEQFHFWATRGQIVERSQIVRARSSFAGGPDVEFYGVVEEVRRVSRKSDMAQEFDKRDGKASSDVALLPEGITYATVGILSTSPSVLTPPLEESEVWLGQESAAQASYGFGDMKRPLPIGLLRNGATATAGAGMIDLFYLLGQFSGHLNISGMTGLGAKSTFLLSLLRLLLHEVRPQAGKDPLYVVPVIFNVKGHDLMWMDRPNKDFDLAQHGAAWADLGLDLSQEAGPFQGAEFYAPSAISGCETTLYSWSLRNVLAARLFPFLFDDERASESMTGLVYDIVNFLTAPDGKTLRSDPGVPQTWGALRSWIWEQVGKKDKSDDPSEVRDIKMHVTATWRAVGRRLWDILSDGGDVFPLDAQEGSPLNVARDGSAPPQVIDIAGLPSSLKRFVVACVVRQIMDERTKADAVPNLSYLVMLDELNRFAPREGRDGITRLLEEIALEGRSRGVILLGAQQFASQVSAKIVESAAIRVAGRCGPGEMEDKTWKSWSKAAREAAASLTLQEKLVSQPTFRAPMLLQMPHPAWAMRKSEIAPSHTSGASTSSSTGEDDSDMPQV